MTHNPETVERVAKAIWPEIGGDATYDEAVKIRDGKMQDDDASPEQHAACLNYAHDLARAALSALPPQEDSLWQGPEDIEDIMNNAMDVDVGTKELAEAVFADYEARIRGALE